MFTKLFGLIAGKQAGKSLVVAALNTKERREEAARVLDEKLCCKSIDEFMRLDMEELRERQRKRKEENRGV